LLNAYWFPGFCPVDDLRGVFGDPHARTEGGKTLQVTIRVEGPGAFNMPWSAWQIYHPTRVGTMEEAAPENNMAFDALVSEIPKPDKQDF
jgi:hypothetical protein